MIFILIQVANRQKITWNMNVDYLISAIDVIYMYFDIMIHVPPYRIVADIINHPYTCSTVPSVGTCTRDWPLTVPSVTFYSQMAIGASTWRQNPVIQISIHRALLLVNSIQIIDLQIHYITIAAIIIIIMWMMRKQLIARIAISCCYWAIS